MEKVLLSPVLSKNVEKAEFLSENLDDEVRNFKPYIIQDVLLLSPGVWNGKIFSKESIINGYYRTDWSNKENYALIYSHDERAENWVGNVINRRITEEGKLYGDLEIYDKNLAIKLGKGKAKLGISAKVFGDVKGEEFVIDSYNNFSVVYDPACKEAFINLSEGQVITSDTSKGSEVKGNVNEKIDYGDKKKKKKKEDEEMTELEEDSNSGKKEENKENMEEKVKEVEVPQEEVSKEKPVEESKEEALEEESKEEESKDEEGKDAEELNSKFDQVLEKLLVLSEKVERLEKAKQELSEEEEEESEKEEASEEKEEEAVEEEESKEEKEEESKEESSESEEESPSKEELAKKLEEAEKKIAELSANDSEPNSHTSFELSREKLGPGARDFSDFEMTLLNILNRK